MIGTMLGVLILIVVLGLTMWLIFQVLPVNHDDEHYQV